MASGRGVGPARLAGCCYFCYVMLCIDWIGEK